jgi:hypothetical protein
MVIIIMVILILLMHAILNERYNYENKPLTVDWNPETNELEFI